MLQDSLLTLTQAQQTLCVHTTLSTYKWTYLLYIYAFICIILYTCLKVCPVGSSNILLNNPVNVYFLLCFKYLLMFLNSYKLDFFFLICKAHSFAKLSCTDPHNGVSALKYTCQTSNPQFLSAIQYFCLSCHVFCLRKRSLIFFKMRHDDDRSFECQERNYL